MIDSSKEPVLVSEQRGHVLVLRLNRPEVRNALNAELIGALGTAFGEAEADPSTRAVVLSGTGDRAFCAGMDLRDFARGVTTSTRPEDMATFARFTRWELSVPVVGAATAAAVAGGFELLLGCDVVVASEKAVFGLPEVKRGLFAAGGCVFLGARIPLAVALELALTGDTIDAHRAYALGLVDEVVPAGEVVAAAVALAERIARTARSPSPPPRSWFEAWARQAEWQPKVFQSEDAREGATAFVEQREPQWRGR